MSDEHGDASITDPDVKHTRNMMDVLREDVRRKFGPSKPTPGPAQNGLAAVVPLDVPRVVVTIHSTTAEEAVQELRKIPQSVPDRVARHPVQIELRLDALHDDNDRAQTVFLVARLGVPIVVTHRAPREGGKNHCSDEERQRLLTKIFASLSDPFPPGSLFDVEASSLASDPEGWKPVIEAARDKNLALMVSHHDHNGTPVVPERLLPPDGFLQQTPGGEALLYKSATSTRDWSEELAVLVAMRQGNHKERRYALMGMGRPTTRLLAPFFGSPLVYSCTQNSSPAAAGQIAFDDLLNTWYRWGVTYEDQGLLAADADEPPPRWALIGRPAMHSLSPAMHNKAAMEQGLPHRYLPLQPPASDDTRALFDETLEWSRRLGIVGGNATAPFKETLARSADRLQGPAEALGVANTFRWEDDRLVVTNTDVDGIRSPLEQAGVTIDQERVLILGAGGAAAAAAYALRDAETVTLTNRTKDNAESLARKLRDHVNAHVVAWDEREQAASSATLIVQTTLLGMAGASGTTRNPTQDPLRGHAFSGSQTLYELVYEPRITPLVAHAKESGARTLDGLEMLLAQGTRSYAFWTGKEPPVDAMRQAVMDAQAIPLPQRVMDAMNGTGRIDTSAPADPAPGGRRHAG